MGDMKSAIVVNESLGPGFLANAAACITSGLFQGEVEILGGAIEGKGFTFIPITKIPILILKQSNKKWEDLLARAVKNKLKYMVFTREGQSTINYGEYEERVRGKGIQEIEVLGIGVLGDDKIVNSFAGDLALLR